MDAGLRVFAAGSYAGATTAAIAAAAGVTEPVLYRHFASKRELWLACVEEAWRRVREATEERAAELGEAQAPLAVVAVGTGLRSVRLQLATLWAQAIVEAGDDPELRTFLRGHLREVHDYIEALFRRSQAAGGMPADRDPAAEAWTTLAGGLLVAVGERIGGLLGHDDFAAVSAARVRWLFGEGS